MIIVAIIAISIAGVWDKSLKADFLYHEYRINATVLHTRELDNMCNVTLPV